MWGEIKDTWGYESGIRSLTNDEIRNHKSKTIKQKSDNIFRQFAFPNLSVKVGVKPLNGSGKNSPRQERKADRGKNWNLWKGVWEDISQKGKGRVQPYSPMGKGNGQRPKRPLQGRAITRRSNSKKQISPRSC